MLALSPNAHHGLDTIGRRSWVSLVLSGLCTGLSWLCYFRALQMEPVGGVASEQYEMVEAAKVEPASEKTVNRELSCFFRIIAGWLFFCESMSPMKIAGAALITVGALVLAFAYDMGKRTYTTSSSLNAQCNVGSSLNNGGVTASTGLLAAERHAGVWTPVIAHKIISAEPQFALAA